MMNAKKELEPEYRGKTSAFKEISDCIEKMKIEHGCKKHNGENEKKKLNDMNTRRAEKNHLKKLKCNKRKEDEGDECKNELTKSKK